MYCYTYHYKECTIVVYCSVMYFYTEHYKECAGVSYCKVMYCNTEHYKEYDVQCSVVYYTVIQDTIKGVISCIIYCYTEHYKEYSVECTVKVIRVWSRGADTV